MSHRERAEQVGQEILDAFRDGEAPRALSLVFIHRDIDIPAARWSWSNRFIAALHGHWDARGFRQWEKAGRHVKKGEHAFHILGPCTVKAKEDDPERGIKQGDLVVVGFQMIPVFGYSQTEGDLPPWVEQDERLFDSLPLVEVARAWGIQLKTYDGEGHERLGFYRARFTTDGDGRHQVVDHMIALGVENPETWAHELLHAADTRAQTRSWGEGEQVDNEIVAELGAAVLLECLGLESESHRGEAWSYIQACAEEHDREPLTVATELLTRTASAVALLLEAADELGQRPGEAGRARAAG